MDQPNNNGAPSVPQGTTSPEEVDQPQFMTSEQYNRAQSARERAFQARFAKENQSQLAAFKAELLAELRPQVESPTDSKETKDWKESPEFKGFLKRQQEVEQQLAEAAKEKQELKAKGLDTSLRQKLTDVLLKNGVDHKAAKLAINAIVDGDKRARWSEDESRIVWRDDDGADVDIESGVKAWAKTEEAKFFLAPRNINGSGAAPSSGSNGAQPASGANAFQKSLMGMLGMPTGGGG